MATTTGASGCAKQLGVSLNTLYRWLRDGVDTPAGYRIGERWRFDQDDIDAWLEEKKKAFANEGAATPDLAHEGH